MISEYITETNIYAPLAEQKEMILRYVGKNELGDVKFVKIPENRDVLSYSMKQDEAFIISDVSLLGAKFEDIMLTLKVLSSRKVKFYSVKEKLEVDTFLPRSLGGNLDACLKLYKGIFSLKNSQIQKNLLKQGKSRGRPVGTGESGLGEKKNRNKIIAISWYKNHRNSKNSWCQ